MVAPGIFGFGLFWVVLYGFGLKYSRSLVRQGITITKGKVTYRTSSYNSQILKTASSLGRKFLRTWFSFGSYFGILVMVGAPILLIVNLIVSSISILDYILGNNDSSNPPQQVLVPIIPGWSIPWTHLTYLMITLIINGVFHELGHGFAAVLYQVRIEAVGFFVFLVYPGAFVELNTEQLSNLSAKRRVRLYSAGVWHNAILALGSFLAQRILPLLLFGLYHHGTGAYVTEVAKDSPLINVIPPGETITGIDHGCVVRSSADFSHCLNNAWHEFTTGASGTCVPKSQVESWNHGHISKNKNGILDCCEGVVRSDSEENSTRLCYVESRSGSAVGFPGYKCMSVREILKVSTARCRDHLDCGKENSCVRHTIDNAESRIIQIHIASKESVLFLGPPEELLHTFSVSNFLPKTSWCSVAIPEHISALLSYMISISSALGILNALPAFAMDGEGVFAAMLDLCLPYDDSDVKETIKLTTCAAGLLLLVLNVLLSMAQLFIFY
eukprot:m.179728 g.179728  ORF g.179728 m.179728 type:complete len:499 (-) comp15480_c1_seq16:3626-5122(-)